MISGELARRAEAMVAERRPFVTATVVRAQRPTSVRPGDAAIVDREGTIDGFVGGECAEASVRLHALRALETGEGMLLRILPGDSEGNSRSEEGAVTVHNPCLSGGALEIFLEPRLPAPVILIHGATPIAGALARLAAELGYSVVRSPDDRGRPDDDDAAVVVASHGHDEELVLAAALRRGVPYVGLVASPTRGAAVREALELPEELKDQLRTPAGLDIGARTPSEVALSILGEIIALGRAAPAALAVAVDPVCGMEVAATAGSMQMEHEGRRLYFCGVGCRDAFAGRAGVV